VRSVQIKEIYSKALIAKTCDKQWLMLDANPQKKKKKEKKNFIPYSKIIISLTYYVYTPSPSENP
jgi:hypothetical protein